MTSVLEPVAPPELTPDLRPPALDRLDDLEAERLGSVEEEGESVSTVSLSLSVVSAALSSAGAAWMVGGIFRGPEARLVAFLGVALGVGLVFAATRFRLAVLQYLVLPAALVVGALLMSSVSGAGTSSLPALVKDAVTSSQVLQPPIDFAPGWQLILVVVLALLSSAAATLALSWRRPRLAVAVPAPLTIVAALAQPAGTAVVTSAVAVGFVLIALATSYAADGVGETFDAGFELRRIGRSLLVGVLLVAALIAASKVSFLFPESDSRRVVPPRRPPISPPQPDVPLYTVRGDLAGPLRVGVIDVYDLKEKAWLLPPVDSQRLQRLTLPTELPGAPAANGTPKAVSVTVQQATGRLLPAPAGARSVKGDATADLDPRTQVLSLTGRPVFTGLTYEVSANPAPTGPQLSALAELEVPTGITEFLTAPTVPPAVEALLAKAPQQPFARLQALRVELYKTFVASGAGKPTDVSAERVVELLGGATGNPYELTASEALLARWAGVPARIGFGYYTAGAEPGAEVTFRPKNAATYLEAWFGPYGWVPIVGTPPKAQQSLSNNQRDNDSTITAADELGINVYLPVLRPDRLPIYAYARYFLVRALPVVTLLGLTLLLYPLVLKRVRRRRRARWALAHGPAGAIAVAYAGLRDQMLDLALPGRRTTPLELLEQVAEDEEHAELAWLVTRGLWGDLRGSLTEEDSATAVQLASSVTRRLTKAQPETARLLAAVARASLRDPWSTELPNVWWEPRLRGRLPSVRVLLRELTGRLRRLRPQVATSAVVLLAVTLLGGCSGSGSADAEPVVAFPTRIAPSAVAGLVVQDEAKASAAYAKGAKDRNVIVEQGKVLSFNRNGLVQAALQVSQLKRGYVSNDPEVADAIARSVGRTRTLRPQDTHDLYALQDGSQRIYLWFPTVKTMALLVVRAEIDAGAAEALARGLIDYGDGGELNETALAAALSAVPPAAGSPPPSAPPPAVPSPEASR